MRRARFSELRAAIEKAAGDPAAVRKLLAEDGAAGDTFGNSISVDGDTAVIGALRDDDNGGESGSAYVFVRAADGTWSQQAKLTAADGSAGDGFGSSVAVDGDTAVIGDPRYKGDFGSAYVFIRAADGTWSQQAKLTATDGTAGNEFGYSVAVEGDRVFIGAWSFISSFGSVYVFVRAADGTWSQQAKLTAGADGDRFGCSVAVNGDTAVIGAEGISSAYVFMHAADGMWSQQAKLISPKDVPILFGSTVSVSGDTVAVGEFAQSYFFTRAADGTWSQQAKLSPPVGAGEWGDWFGPVVALSGDTAVIGAYGHDDKGEDSGAAYVFVRAADGTWSQQAKLTAPDGAAEDFFGSSVAVDGDIVVIGAVRDDDRGENSGSAYVFVRAADGTWSQQAVV